MVHDSSARTVPCSRACDAPACTDMQQPGPSAGRAESPLECAGARVAVGSADLHPASACAELLARSVALAPRARVAACVAFTFGASAMLRARGSARALAGWRPLSLPRRPDGNGRTCALAGRAPGERHGVCVPPSRERYGVRAQATSRECDAAAVAACAHAEAGWRRGETAFHSASDVACAC